MTSICNTESSARYRPIINMEVNGNRVKPVQLNQQSDQCSGCHAYVARSLVRINWMFTYKN